MMSSSKINIGFYVPGCITTIKLYLRRTLVLLILYSAMWNNLIIY